MNRSCPMTYLGGMGEAPVRREPEQPTGQSGPFAATSQTPHRTAERRALVASRVRLCPFNRSTKTHDTRPQTVRASNTAGRAPRSRPRRFPTRGLPKRTSRWACQLGPVRLRGGGSRGVRFAGGGGPSSAPREPGTAIGQVTLSASPALDNPPKGPRPIPETPSPPPRSGRRCQYQTKLLARIEAHSMPDRGGTTQARPRNHGLRRAAGFNVTTPAVA
ncbi:hypothetical protein LX36DRAFT_242605 [Colletotrichum falcatum]|nr:hypothetical protein LX36DRAFT_242605 [Colletotrichum falcatum]